MAPARLSEACRTSLAGEFGSRHILKSLNLNLILFYKTYLSRAVVGRIYRDPAGHGKHLRRARTREHLEK